MTRFEFTESLRKALSGRVNHRVVNENVAYYEHYIDAEIKKGRSEEDVLGGLGDPRLLAKTIVDTTGESDRVYADEGESKDPASGGTLFGRIFRLPAWLVLLVLVLLFILIIKIVGLVIVTVPFFSFPRHNSCPKVCISHFR